MVDALASEVVDFAVSVVDVNFNSLDDCCIVLLEGKALDWRAIGESNVSLVGTDIESSAIGTALVWAGGLNKLYQRYIRS